MIYRLIKIIHRLYKISLSIAFGGNCRFSPYCSDYTLECIKKFGIIKGCTLGLIRVLKCNSLHSCGEDPVPDKFRIKLWNKKN